jgi:repressor LexA
MKVPFNVNGYVWVKLNAAGLKILKHNDDWLRLSFASLPPFAPPATDENGYTKYQLWSLMNDFGQYMTWGAKSPFETDVFFETKEK